jgi:hypothetical protein
MVCSDLWVIHQRKCNHGKKVVSIVSFVLICVVVFYFANRNRSKFKVESKEFNFLKDLNK